MGNGEDPSRFIRVLLVDDDEDIRDSVSEVLRERGYEVECAIHGGDALEQLRGGLRPTVILLDLMMPVMDGWQFRAQLKNDPELSKIPVIVITAAASYWGIPEETSASLRKPFDLTSLLREIERCA